MTSNDELRKKLFFGSVQEKLVYAGELYKKYGETLLDHLSLCSELCLLDEYGRQLQAQMLTMKMGEQCIRCASRQRGGCCSDYMAGETDGIQLLINMLLGIEPRRNSESQTECCYLQEKGCIFMIKPMFCLNYLCQNIRETATQEDLDTLQKLTGKLLSKQYEIEKMVLNLVRELSTTSGK